MYLLFQVRRTESGPSRPAAPSHWDRAARRERERPRAPGRGAAREDVVRSCELRTINARRTFVYF